MTMLTLTEDLKNLFTTLFKSPIAELVSLKLIQNPIDTTSIKDIHRNIVLKQGRADFTVDSNGLTTSQKVDLYCFYYFQMHFTSSYIFYSKEIQFLTNEIKNKNVWFIDIGCGPFTSGCAFNDLLSKIETPETKSINYIGIDTSQSMLNKAEEVKKNLKKDNFEEVIFITDKFKVSDTLRSMAGNLKDLLLIINYSYVFASHSLDVEDFVRFTNEIINVYCGVEKGKVIIMQQNPKRNDLNSKWLAYKQQLTNLKQVEAFPKPYDFQFEDILGSSNFQAPRFQVNCDIIKTFL